MNSVLTASTMSIQSIFREINTCPGPVIPVSFKEEALGQEKSEGVNEPAILAFHSHHVPSCNDDTP